MLNKAQCCLCQVLLESRFFFVSITVWHD